MPVILGLLGAIVSIVVLLHRLADAGIDLGGLNPFLWKRRQGWRQKFEANPIFSLQDPKDIAGILVVGVAKADGDMTAAEKTALLGEFESTFALKTREATELLASSVFLLGDANVLATQLDDILRNAAERLAPEQTSSMLAVMDRIASVDGPPTLQQTELIEQVTARLTPRKPEGTWA